MERIPVERKVLNENDRIAGELRTQFARHNVLCLNLISSPGSGKTTLLERTLESFAPAERVAVLTGDIQTENDAKRLARFGFPVKQITTGGTCHLDARMIERALADWSLEDIDLLLIENVGNLVCPSSYDLGEKEKIVLLSVTEGEDKPLKYPSIFFKSNLLVLTKLDLLMHVPFQLAAAEENARRIHNEMEIVKVSCLTRDGVQSWLEWLSERRRRVRTAAMAAEHRTAESTKV
jgi:hydrogenase nickel incorporation protein HypB